MATFRRNPNGLRQYLKSGDLYPALEAKAKPIESRAISNAPVDTGDFRDSIHTERHMSPTRTTVRVVADAPGSVPIEWRHRALGRAVQ